MDKLMLSTGTVHQLQGLGHHYGLEPHVKVALLFFAFVLVSAIDERGNVRRRKYIESILAVGAWVLVLGGGAYVSVLGRLTRFLPPPPSPPQLLVTHP